MPETMHVSGASLIEHTLGTTVRVNLMMDIQAVQTMVTTVARDQQLKPPLLQLLKATSHRRQK